MQLEECFLEMVCHARWVFNYCITRLSPETRQIYASDISTLQIGLDSISQPQSADEEVLDIPSAVVAALCRGVGYLLLGEDILGKAPNTMHPFLRQTAATRKESTKQAQVIVVRWFINVGLVSIEELLAVIYGPETTLEHYESDYDAHMAVAVSLCSEEPFYLGAHVTILRALLLRYCTTVFTAEDIIAHVTKINPSAAVPLYTLEDTLLHWMRTVLGLVPRHPLIQDLSDGLGDLYVNTNDGRALSLVVHYYRPDLLAMEDIQLVSELPNTASEEGGPPLARWQRESNWSSIIRASEELGLWVGIFSEELVSHGFCTLQLHILRIAEELFAILAVGAEERMESILAEAHCDEQLIVRSSTNHKPTHHSPNDFSGVSVELDNDTSLVMVGDGHHSPPKSIMGVTDQDNYDEGAEVFTSKVITSSLVGNQDAYDRLDSPSMASAAKNDSLGVKRGPSTSVNRSIFSDTDTQEIEDPLASKRKGDYNIILTNMFLQGIAMPISKRSADSASAIQPTKTDFEPIISGPKIKGKGSEENLKRSLQETQDLSAFVVKSSKEGGVLVSQVVEVTPFSAPNPISVPEGNDHDGPELVIGTSPHKSDNTRPSTKLTGRQAQSEIDSDIPVINRSVQKINEKPIVSMSTGRSSAALFGPSVVQGSIHKEGIADLIAELRAVYQAPPATVSSLESTQQVRQQNQELRSALQRQQQLVEVFLTKVQKCLTDSSQLHEVVEQLHVTSKDTQQRSRHVSTKSIAVGSSFAGGSLNAASPQHRKLPAIEEVNTINAVIPQNKPLPALLSVSKLRASQEMAIDEMSHQQRQPIAAPKQLSVVKSLVGAPNSNDLPKLTKPPAPPVMDISIDALKCNPSKGKSKGIPPRLAKRLQQAQPEAAAMPLVQETPQENLVDGKLPAIAQPRRKSDSAVPPKTQPSIRTWNNRSNVTLALKLALLSGDMNKPALENIIGVMDRAESDQSAEGGGSIQFVVLLKDEFAHAFKGLYMLKPDGMLSRLYGAGPTAAYVGPPLPSDNTKLFPKFFKYETTSKKFVVMPHKEANQTTDAVSFAKVTHKINRASVM